jgi:gamma-aminobutyric acid receptor subunit rho
MKFGCSNFRGILVCAVFLVAAVVGASTRAAESAVSCELPKMNIGNSPREGDASTKIALGIYLVDINEIDDVKQQFTADFAVFQTWKDRRLKGLNGCRFDLKKVWSPEFTFLNSGRVFPEFTTRAIVGPDGAVSYIQRYRGSMSFRHALHEFPFDKHTIRIAMMPVRQVGQAYELVVDGKKIGRQKDLTILDWTFGNVTGRISPADHPVTGDPIDLFYFEIPAKRHYQYYVWKVLMPLMLIVAMSWSVFWINPAKFGPQIGMSATSMLTLIAFQFAMASILPHLSYFTLLDAFITAATGLVFLALVESLTTSYLVSMDRAALALRIDRTCRWAFPLAFVVMVVSIFGI